MAEVEPLRLEKEELKEGIRYVLESTGINVLRRILDRDR